MHRIVVVGGGIAGIVTATHLSRRLTRSKTAEILLTDHNRAHVWKPMLSASPRRHPSDPLAHALSGSPARVRRRPEGASRGE